MTRRLRVTFCLANSGIGGTELNAVRTAERLDPERYDVEVVSFNDYEPLRARYESADITYEVLPVRSLRGSDWVREGWRLARHLRGRGTDVFHAHDSYGNLLGVPWARLAGIPAVIASRRWFLSPPGRGHGGANRLANRWAHAVVTNTDAVADLVVSEGVSPAKVRIIPNFVDRNAFMPAAPEAIEARRVELGIPTDAKVVGIVAQLRPEKDHVTLLRAAARMGSRHPTAHFVLIGEGRCRPEIEELRADLRLEDRVHLAGLRHGQDNLHHLFDISVLCSHTEALSNSILEGMAAGNPLTVTDVGGNPDAVVDGETGLVVPVGDAESLAAALDRLLSDEAFAERLGAAGRARAENRYTVEAALTALGEMYHDLLGADRRAPVATSPHAA
ncbi:MAG: glycosyltransferase [Gemmatimonadetes bacterium]|nr:glycosyltransferase [Gemmatimonadota bacterium]